MTYSNLVLLPIFGEIYHVILVVAAMITTVTTVSTITAIAASELTSTMSLMVVVALIVFLGTKELASTGHSRFSLRLGELVGTVICPLIMAFAVILAVKITQLL